MKKFLNITLSIFLITLLAIIQALFAQTNITPFELLKEQEIKHKDSKGVICLGNVMTLNYPPDSIDINQIYYPLLLEITDVLKTPSRKNYSVILKGYTDSRGSPEINLRLSERRAEFLKKIMVEKYYMRPERIKTKGFGIADPVASNETAEGRRLNRRVEIHIYGDVSEAVKFSTELEVMK